MFKFETLDIWKRSIKFATKTYQITSKFPKEENFNLTSQLKRASVSISLNIAEGSARKSKIDFKRFIQIARGSLNEVVTCLYIAVEQKYINQEDFKIMYSECEEISRMLQGFIKFLDQE